MVYHRIITCPRCGRKLYRTEENRYFCINCGVLNDDELKDLEIKA